MHLFIIDNSSVFDEISATQLIDWQLKYHIKISKINSTIDLENLLKETLSPNPNFYERAKLSDYQIRLMALIRDGFNNHEISDALHISISTVRNNLFRLYKKINVKNRAQALAYCIENNVFNH